MTIKEWDGVVEACSGDVRRLADVWRFGSIPILIRENTSDHSYYVSLYSVLVHRVVRPDDTNLIGSILLHAVLHDLMESKLSDVIQPLKYTTPELKAEIDRAELIHLETFEPEIKELFKLENELMGEQADYVKKIVKAADFMSLYQYMIREWNSGNRRIRPFYLKMINDLSQAGIKIGESENLEDKLIADLYFNMAGQAASLVGYRPPRI